MKLRALQGDFRHWLVDGSDEAADRFELGARQGLLVYQNNYRSQLLACLSETFERLHSWLGDEAFLAAAIVHIDAHPPTYWTLDAYPAEFPETLKRIYPEDREIAELAWIDWALAQAFTARDIVPLTPPKIAQVDWDRAGIAFTPSLTMTGVSTNAAAIWSALAASETPPPAQPLPEGAVLMVWRQAFTPRFRTIDTLERDAITQMLAGESFAALCSALVEHAGETEGVTRAGNLLGQWLADGLIVGTPSHDEPMFPEG